MEKNLISQVGNLHVSAVGVLDVGLGVTTPKVVATVAVGEFVDDAGDVIIRVEGRTDITDDVIIVLVKLGVDSVPGLFSEI